MGKLPGRSLPFSPSMPRPPPPLHLPLPPSSSLISCPPPPFSVTIFWPTVPYSLDDRVYTISTMPHHYHFCLPPAVPPAILWMPVLHVFRISTTHVSTTQPVTLLFSCSALCSIPHTCLAVLTISTHFDYTVSFVPCRSKPLAFPRHLLFFFTPTFLPPHLPLFSPCSMRSAERLLMFVLNIFFTVQNNAARARILRLPTLRRRLPLFCRLFTVYCHVRWFQVRHNAIRKRSPYVGLRTPSPSPSFPTLPLSFLLLLLLSSTSCLSILAPPLSLCFSWDSSYSCLCTPACFLASFLDLSHIVSSSFLLAILVHCCSCNCHSRLYLHYFFFFYALRTISCTSSLPACLFSSASSLWGVCLLSSCHLPFLPGISATFLYVLPVSFSFSAFTGVLLPNNTAITLQQYSSFIFLFPLPPQHACKHLYAVL